MKNIAVLKFIAFILFSITTSFYLFSRDEFFRPFVEDFLSTVFIPVICFLMIMKMFSFGALEIVHKKSFFQLFTQLTYHFRYPIAIVILFFLMFHNIGKEYSFAYIFEEYHFGDTKEKLVTVQYLKDNILYDQHNKQYTIYNQNVDMQKGKTYKITYLKNSKIVIDIKGP